ncbi:peptidoglycan DD-metalloendopeptidase family protein [Undibacterium fentianense]|uniref:Peptidoglycan DD-metalloendopeptidase family protein n=1 Tax=Undibacterium fentianense TaxID=2828728 RepID=A0A941IEU7_9BURK|nr:peptidoglycan DD-metalloendopeptidase family protein [Undibacterium fentianense]MBR7798420.1 peptidoglycan DD-metalloendopeptidase family protein [Undibacterium fentianense]
MKLSWSLKNSLSLGALILLVACSSVPNNAPVVERSQDVPNKTEKNTPEPAEKKVTPRLSYVVKRGDTLSRIAIDNSLNINDLISWNNLKNPSDIKVDQVLWLAAADGDTAKTSPIAGSGGIEVRNLTPINPATHKTSPKGEKRSYSESNLAELQKESGANLGVTKSEVAAVKNGEKESAGAVAPIDWGWPAVGKVLGSFDEQKNKGIDIGGRAGQDIVAAANGKVIYEVAAVRGYGNMVVITHANDYLTIYAHNKLNFVKKGQVVKKGQKIAEMGNSDSDTVKLHFEIRQGGKAVDPTKLLPAK